MGLLLSSNNHSFLLNTQTRDLPTKQKKCCHLNFFFLQNILTLSEGNEKEELNKLVWELGKDICPYKYISPDNLPTTVFIS